jgi:hypothetical protein
MASTSNLRYHTPVWTVLVLETVAPPLAALAQASPAFHSAAPLLAGTRSHEASTS